MRQWITRSLEQQSFAKHTNYYVDTAQNIFQGQPLSGNIQTKTLIIGGGFAGLATAMSMMERGKSDFTLIEANHIGYGASGRNGGFVFGGFSLGESALLKKLGAKEGRWAYNLTTQAIERIRARTQQHNIQCDMVSGGAILANWFNESLELRAKQAFMKTQLGVDWSWLDAKQIREAINTPRYFNGLFEQNAFHFHPLKYAKGLAKILQEKGIKIYENTPATAINKSKVNSKLFCVSTPKGDITAEKVVLACGGYIDRFYQPVARAILPISTYVMVTEPLGDEIDYWLPTDAAIYDTRFAFDYYRKLQDKRLLWGGRISILQRDPEAVQQLLKRDLLKVFPGLSKARIDYAWGGLMGYPIHKMAMIGQTQPNLWHVTGFGGHGVAPTTTGGELVAKAIVDGSYDYQKLKDFNTQYALGPLGLAGSQLTYWAYQALDWVKEKGWVG